MSHLAFHNDTLSLNHIWFESHRNLIATVCIKLDKIDQIEELTNSILGNPLKIKPMKDPNKPKRAASAYLFFCEAERPKVMKSMAKNNKDSKIKLGDVAKELGKRWKSLSEDARNPFVKKADKDKQRYEEAMAEYKNNL